MLKTYFFISRPRFWMYLVGPALVGVASLPSPLAWLENPAHVALLLAWTFPANMLLYGCNDLSDEDTDTLNVKKQGYEVGMEQRRRTGTLLLVAGCSALLAGAAVSTGNTAVMGWVTTFFALAIGYSVPPLRCKARPYLDSLSNVLYILPGFAITATVSMPIAPSVFFGGWCWAAAMHLFSAIPDIVPDSLAKLSTTAVVLGKHRALMACSALWLIAAICAASTPAVGMLGWLGVIYVLIPLLLLKAPDAALFKAYAAMPLVNTVLGGMLFWSILLS